jgi:Bromodomain/TAZ zinc finger
MAKSLEEHLYRSATSKDEYMNLSTLKVRLQTIAHGLDLHRTTSSGEGGSGPSLQQSSSTNYSTSGTQGSLSNASLSGNLPSQTSTMNQGNSVWVGGSQATIQSSHVANHQGHVGSGNANTMGMQRNTVDQQSIDNLASAQVNSYGGNSITAGLNCQSDSNWSSNLGSTSNMTRMLGQSSSIHVGNANLSGAMHQESMGSIGSMDIGSLSSIDPLQSLNWGLSSESMPAPNTTGGVGGMMVSDYPNTPKYQDSGASQKKKVILQQQQRLLLLRHASKCKAGSACSTKFCSQMVTLWKHMKTCRDKHCKTSHCVSSRCVLNHYRICKSQGKTSTCEVCGPVMAKIRQQESDDGAGDPLATDPSASMGSRGVVSGPQGLPGFPGQGSSSMALQVSVRQHQPMSLQSQVGIGMTEAGSSTQGQSEQAQLQQLQAQQLRLQAQLDSLKQLQKQQEELLQQQANLQEQSQHVKDPNSQQAQLLQQQQLLLHQLQQRCEHQQLLLQQEIQTQSRAAGLAQVQAQFRAQSEQSAFLHLGNSIAAGASMPTAEKKKRSASVSGPKSKRVSSKAKRGEKLSQVVDRTSSGTGADIAFETTAPAQVPKRRASATASKTSKKKAKVAGAMIVVDSGPLESRSMVAPPDMADAIQNTSVIPALTTDNITKHLSSLNKMTRLSARTVTQKCLPILQELVDDQFGWVFRDAVDPLAMGLPDYFDVVKNPMYLELVKKKLQNAIYSDTKSFAHDVKLVFENAILYNGESSEVGVLANSFLTRFEHLYKALVQGTCEFSSARDCACFYFFYPAFFFCRNRIFAAAPREEWRSLFALWRTKARVRTDCFVLSWPMRNAEYQEERCVLH